MAQRVGCVDGVVFLFTDDKASQLRCRWHEEGRLRPGQFAGRTIYSQDSPPTSSTTLPPVNGPRSGEGDEEPPRFSLGSSLLVAPRCSLGSLEEVVSLPSNRRVCSASGFPLTGGQSVRFTLPIRNRCTAARTREAPTLAKPLSAG